MGMSGDLYRVTPSRLEELLADPEQISAELYPDEETAEHQQRSHTVDKAWCGLQFLLDRYAEAKRRPPINPLPWYIPTENGTETGAELHYGPVCFRRPEAVAQLARELSAITEADLRASYLPDRMLEEEVYPTTWDRPGEFEFLWVHFQALTEFYAAAAREDDAMLLWLA